MENLLFLGVPKLKHFRVNPSSDILLFLNNLKDLDLFYEMGLDFWDCLGRKKQTLSYNQRNMVYIAHSLL